MTVFENVIIAKHMRARHNVFSATFRTSRKEEARMREETEALLREQGEQPYILSTEACAICERCAILDGQPCRHKDRMHPCVESQGINIIPTLEANGLEFQYGSNVVTWVSLLLFYDAI